MSWQQPYNGGWGQPQYPPQYPADPNLQYQQAGYAQQGYPPQQGYAQQSYAPQQSYAGYGNSNNYAQQGYQQPQYPPQQGGYSAQPSGYTPQQSPTPTHSYSAPAPQPQQPLPQQQYQAPQPSQHAPAPAPAPSSASSSPSPVPALKPIVAPAPPNDPKGHKLQWGKQPYKGKYLCDVCKAPSRDAMHRWICLTCQYDLCPACHPAPGAPPRPSCSKNHQLKWGVIKYDQGEYSCDKCKSLHGCAERRWVCEICKYDLCTVCHPMPYPAGAGNFSPRPPQPNVIPAAPAPQAAPPQAQPATAAHTQTQPAAPAPNAPNPLLDNSVWVPPAPEYAASLPPVKVESYSQGRRKALVIGINYLKNPRAKLDGCINDAKNIQYFLSQHKFEPENVKVLTDDTTDDSLFPNKANMLKWMEWLVKGAQPGDSLWFSFSGHGSQTKDLNGDEAAILGATVSQFADGMDETILPADYTTSGQIVDDDLYRIMVLSLPRGVRLTGIMDCCHSGTGIDLPIVYDGTVARDAEEFDIQRGVLKRSHNQPRQVKSRGLSDPPLAIMFSGCEDQQTSADATGLAKPGIATGALTFLFLEIVTKNPVITFDAIMQELRKTLKSKGFTQVPQLSYNVPFNLTGKFCL